ncbi:SBBP repeat-containing protein [Bacteroidota bacterium]
MLKVLISSALILSNSILLNDTNSSAVEFSNRISEKAALHIPFISNEGQLPDNILYYAPLLTGNVYIDKEGTIGYSIRPGLSEKSCNMVIQERFINSVIKEISNEGNSSVSINRITGRGESFDVTRLESFDNVILKETYPGIDVKLSAFSGGIEKLFYVHPDAEPDCILIAIMGNDDLALNSNGQLEIKTVHGQINFTKPVAFQIVDGKKNFIDVEYTISGNNYGFKIDDYDHSKDLIIDPLIASTFIGGTENDGDFTPATKMAIDSEGFIYIAGTTFSYDFPTTLHAYAGEKNLNGEIFISKFSSDLSRLYSSTFIGGNDYDELKDFSLDNDNNIFICGTTHSTDFPVLPDGFQQDLSEEDPTAPGSGDAFISKLSNDLSNLLASTYLGGERADQIRSLSIDNNGDVIVAGATGSRFFPMIAGDGYRYLKYAIYSIGNFDGFISKFNSELTTLLSSTFFGTSADDDITSIMVAENGNIYVGGYSNSTRFPTTDNAYNTDHNNSLSYGRYSYDGFVSCFDNTLNILISSTYYGGSYADHIDDICIGNDGNIFVAGHTVSDDLPTSFYSPNFNLSMERGDVFIAKFNPELSELFASTYLGGNQSEFPSHLCIDQEGVVYISGTSYSDDFPVTENAYDKIYQGALSFNGDIFISKFDNNLSSLSASTYLGGSFADRAGTILVDNDGSVIVAGSSYSPDYPVTQNTYRQFLNWSYDVIITRLDSDLSADPTGTKDNDDIPEQFILYANYPNPFNPTTNIRFDLPSSEFVNLTVYNLLGEKISNLISEIKPAGIHTINFDASDLKSGMYIYRIEAGNFVESRKMLLVK